MPYNGSGVYSPPSNSWAPAVAATTISSSDWNTLRADIATALSTCLLKDGQQTATGHQPMGVSYRHTSVANAIALDQYATADQVVDNALCYGGASAAGSDTYAVNLAVSPGAYAAGQQYSFKADVANTGACTINFNTIGAASIKNMDGTDPASNSIIAGQIVELFYDGTNMILLNPAYNSVQTLGIVEASKTVTADSTASFTFSTSAANRTIKFDNGTYFTQILGRSDGRLGMYDVTNLSDIYYYTPSTQILTITPPIVASGGITTKGGSDTVSGSTATSVTVGSLDSTYTDGFECEAFIIGASLQTLRLVLNADATATNYVNNYIAVDNAGTVTGAFASNNILGSVASGRDCIVKMKIVQNPTLGECVVYYETQVINSTEYYTTGSIHYATTDNISSIAIQSGGLSMAIGSYLKVKQTIATS